MSRKHFFWDILTTWLLSPGYLQRLLQIGIIVLCLILSITIQVYMTEWGKIFIQSLTDYDKTLFLHQISLFLPLLTTYVILHACKEYLIAHLGIEWRMITTAQIREKWLKNKNYYFMGIMHKDIDHPDQRFTQDIKFVTADALNLLFLMLETIGSLIIFSIMLWKYSPIISLKIFGTHHAFPGLLFYIALLYASLGTIIAYSIGRKIVPITIEQEKREATMRHHLIRLIENAQAIALSNGEPFEKKVFLLSFHDIYSNFHTLLNRIVILQSYTNFYKGLSSWLPMMILSPYYFSKVFTFGTLNQINGIFGHVNDGLSMLTYNYNEIFKWLASLTRLYTMDCAMNTPYISTPIPFTPYIACQDVTILDTENKIICQIPDFKLHSGERLLIKGPSGCGKSTFLRTLFGLHPTYSGTIHMPSEKHCISANIYLPLGSLHDILNYPDHHLHTQDIQTLLKTLQLEHFLHYQHFEEFPQELISMGEKQRLMLAQAFLTPSKTWLFLDEPTSHLNTDLGQDIMRKILDHYRDAGVVVISHNPYPEDWFDTIIHLTST